MVDLLRTFHLGRVVREVLVDGEVEVEGTILVHALIRVNAQREIEDVVLVRKFKPHGAAQGEL